MLRKRIIGLDAAKAIAMFCVVLLHYAFYSQVYANCIPENLVTAFTSIGVPLFFLVNGYLLFGKKYDYEKHRKKILKIVTILLVWKLITLPIASVLSGFAISKSKWVSYMLGASYDSIGYFWFMNALIAVYLVFPVLKLSFDDQRIGKVRLRNLCILLALFVFGVNAINDVYGIFAHVFGISAVTPFNSLLQFNIFGEYSYVLVYFIVGGLLPDIMLLLRDRLKHKYTICVSSIAIVSFILLAILQRYQAVTENKAFVVDNGYLNLLVLLLAVSLLILLLGIDATDSKLNEIMSVFGANTLGVYYLHYIIIIVFQKIICNYINGTLPLAVNLACAFILYCICLIITIITKNIPIIGEMFKG